MNKPNSKYVKGERIKSLDELMQQDLIYFHERVCNIGWFQNWQLRFTRACMDRGCVYKAVIREPEKQETEELK